MHCLCPASFHPVLCSHARAWYRNVLMVGFQFAVWLLAATPVCFGETRRQLHHPLLNR